MFLTFQSTFLNSGETRVYWQEPKLFEGNCVADAAAAQATSKSERQCICYAINWCFSTCHTNAKQYAMMEHPDPVIWWFLVLNYACFCKSEIAPGLAIIWVQEKGASVAASGAGHLRVYSGNERVLQSFMRRACVHVYIGTIAVQAWHSRECLRWAQILVYRFYSTSVSYISIFCIGLVPCQRWLWMWGKRWGNVTIATPVRAQALWAMCLSSTIWSWSLWQTWFTSTFRFGRRMLRSLSSASVPVWRMPSRCLAGSAWMTLLFCRGCPPRLIQAWFRNCWTIWLVKCAIAASQLHLGGGGSLLMLALSSRRHWPPSGIVWQFWRNFMTMHSMGSWWALSMAFGKLMRNVGWLNWTEEGHSLRANLSMQRMWSAMAAGRWINARDWEKNSDWNQRTHMPSLRYRQMVDRLKMIKMLSAKKKYIYIYCI